MEYLNSSPVVIILAICGSVASILGFVYLFKRIKPQTRLLFECSECYSMIKSIANMFGLHVSIDNQIYNNALIFAKFKVINTGLGDIDRKDIHEPVSISINDRFKWIKIRAEQSDSGIKPEVSFNGNAITVSWALLRVSEYITIDTIIENIDNDQNIKNLLESIVFNHRISNTHHTEYIYRVSFPRISFFDEIVIHFMLLIFLLVGVFIVVAGYLAKSLIICIFGILWFLWSFYILLTSIKRKSKRKIWKIMRDFFS